MTKQLKFFADMNFLKKAPAFVAAQFFLLGTGLFGQDVWSLERCVRHAQETNVSVKQAQIGIKNAQIDQAQAEKSRLPNLSLGTSIGNQTGRSFNQVAGTITTTSVQYNGFQLQTSMPLYQGGQVKNQIEQSKFDVSAAKADADRTANDLALQVAGAFLNCLLTEENAENAKKRLAQTNEQLGRTDKLIAAGTLPQNERLQILAQIAREEGQLISSQNQIDLAYLSLKNLLQVEPDYPMKLERPEVAVPADANPDVFALKMLFNSALGTQPQIRAGEFREKSAFVGEDIARSAFRPSVSLSGSAGTNYNSQFLDFATREKLPYFDQLDQNFGTSVGLNLSVPIYQNGRARLGVERAKLAILQTQNQNLQLRQTLKNDIQTAIANAKAAKKTFEAAEKTVTAFSAAFENSKKRFDLGALNALELSQAKTNFDTAVTDQLVAKYDYLFKLKILDFYQGKKLSLD